MRRLFRSATINTWISILVRMGGMMLLLPLVLRHLELQQVLVWQLLASITAMLAWIDFGITPTFSRFIAVARGGGRLSDLATAHGRLALPPERADQPLRLTDVARTAGRIYAVMALLGTCVVVGIGTLAVAGPISGLPDPAQGWMAWGMVALSVPFALMNSSNASVLIGCDRIAELRRVDILIGFCQLLTTSVTVVLTSDLGWIAATYYAWFIIQFWINLWMRHRTLAAEAPEADSRFDPDLFRAAWAAGWRSGVGVMFSTGIIQGSGMVVPQIAPAEIAAPYLIVLRLMTIASQLSQAPFYSRLPAMVKARAEGHEGEVVQLAARGLKLSLWTMLIGVAAIIFVAPPLLDWIGGSVRLPVSGLSVLLGLAFFAERYGAMHMQLYTLSNHVIWHRVNGLTGVVMLVSFPLLWSVAGTAALPLAMLAGYGLYLCPTISRRALAFLGQKRWEFEKRTALLPTLGLLACVMFFALRYALA